ncbi:hypothetical protein EU538_12860 [Candidatus Thorarchaeota archaeon]|jgi:hypothetical protein|nr:MAG: hypothetical protein EU538_12860 [Candidatus Thorarchaeota archaeon]
MFDGLLGPSITLVTELFTVIDILLQKGRDPVDIGKAMKRPSNRLRKGTDETASGYLIHHTSSYRGQIAIDSAPSKLNILVLDSVWIDEIL